MSISTRRKLLEQPEHVLTSGEWYVITPEESTNLLSNPSFEVATTGWSASGTGVTITRDTAESYYGAACGRMSDASPTNSGNEIVISPAAAASAGTPYTFSFRYKKNATGAQTGTAYIQFLDGSSNILLTVSLTLARGNVKAWRFASITALAPASTATVRGLFSTVGVSSGQFDLYIDGAQMEAKPHPTTYIDGSQEDCVWIGAPNASASYRPPTTRKGGRLQPMTNYKFRIGAIIGAGAAALSTLATPYAQTGGGYYQGSIAPPRVITLAGAFECDSAIDLARRRAELFAAVNPLATPQGQPARLVYVPQSCGDNIAEGVVIDGVYGGGLEGNLTNDYGQERAALTFTTYLPFAALGKSTKDGAASLGLSSAPSPVSDIVSMSRYTGTWSTLNGGGSGGDVYNIVRTTDGLYYVMGTFTAIGGVSASYFARWTGSTFAPLGTPPDVPNIRAADVGPDNSLYVSIPTMGAEDIYRWNGSTWTKIGTIAGGSGLVHDLIVGLDGAVYIAGSFTSVSSVSANNIARWNGSAWSALGSGASDRVWSLAVGKDGSIYAGGQFATMGGVTVNGIARWNGTAWSALGSGISRASLTAKIRELYVARDGRLYANGDFDTAGGVSAANIAVWNGAGWQPLGAGITKVYGNPEVISEDNGPGVIVAGYFNVNGSANIASVARWTGSEWIPGPVYFSSPASNRIDSVWFSQNEAVYGGTFTTIALPSSSVITASTQTNNVTLTITGPGTPVFIRNHTTGNEIYFNITLNAGEVMTVYIGEQVSAKTNFRGDVTSALIGVSQTSQFRLLPGANNVSFFMINTTGASGAALTFKEMLASLDFQQ